MEPEVKDQQVVHVIDCGFSRTGVSFGLGNGFFKQWFDFVCLIASDQETVVKVSGPFPSVLLRGAECLDSKKGSIDNTRQEAWWMGRCWRDVEVQVQVFFIQGCGELTAFQLDGDVKEVHLSCQISGDPGQAWGIVEVLLEQCKSGCINGWVGVADPHKEDVVNESSVEGQVLSKGCHQCVLSIDCHVEDCYDHCWWCPHGNAIPLPESHVSKGEDIVAHH